VSYVANNWVDWREVVEYDVVYGSDLNSEDYGPYGEWINSQFITPSGKTFNLESASEGVIRLRFDWIGGGTPPSNISFNIWTEALAYVNAPNGYDDLEFYVFSDGDEATWDITSTVVTVESGTNREGGVVTYNASPVYYEVGILNSISATVDDDAIVATESAFSIWNIQ
jgi:hypothetical protein